MTSFLQALLDATSAGAVYALAALGIGLVFGVLRLANFAYGEIITASAYTLIIVWPINPVLALLGAAVVGVGVALVMNYAVFSWLRSQSAATLLIASFGLSILLQRIYEGIFGANVLSASVASGLSTSVNLGGVRLNLLSVVTIVLAAVLLVGVQLFLTRTSIGLQVQAASADFRIARLLGVRSGLVIAVTFAISGFIAAAVAFVLTVQSGTVDPSFGVQPTLFGLIGAVIGGLRNLRGAVVGGFVVGVALSLLTSWLPPEINPFRTAFVYLLVIAVLVLRPNGLFSAGAGKVRT